MKAAEKMEKEFPPAHIAIIMDGNGRWAKQRGLPRISGHKKGAESVKEAIEACIENSVSYLTLYAFSSENWNRPTNEVEGLMELLNFYLGKELKQLHENGIKLKVIGEKKLLSNKIKDKISKAEQLTANNNSLSLTIALSYGGRQEIVRAVNQIVKSSMDKKLDGNQIDENIFESFLYTSGIPDPDLLIRTSGEKRLSNFLLWQLAYTELFFTDVLWPDFKKEHVLEAINDFIKRERRYGNS
jgi:undecaprenyl diphosphate synthase